MLFVVTIITVLASACLRVDAFSPLHVAHLRRWGGCTTLNNALESSDSNNSVEINSRLAAQLEKNRKKVSTSKRLAKEVSLQLVYLKH